MTSTLAATLASVERTEQTTALRHLLKRPWTRAVDDSMIFSLIVRQRDWLVTWFAAHPGWKLIIDPTAGFARLYKVSTTHDTTRPAAAGTRGAFNRRRYVLLWLTLAAVDDAASQTTLGQLAELVQAMSTEDSAVAAFDPGVFAERRAFVDVLRWLIDVGVLKLRDGDTEQYAHSRQGDALFDVDDRLLSHVVAAPIPPAIAASAARLSEEHYPNTDEGERLRARHGVIRRLLDEPVLYYDELTARELAWLDHSRAFLYRLLAEDVGLAVERRREGLAAIEPAGELTDIVFPDGSSTVKHAALLLAEYLAVEAREASASDATITLRIAALMADYADRCHWSKQYTGSAEGAADLGRDAVALLAALHLVERVADGWRARPAIARFSPAAPVAGV